MLPPDIAPSAPLTIGEQTDMLTGVDDKVSPATFPVPTPSPDYIETLASDLRSAGESVGDTGNDITSAWGGLTTHYKAPEAEVLHSVLDPVAADGDTVSTDLGHAASALETFAADLRDIKSRWSSLSAEAFGFRARIDAKGEDWRKAEGVSGFFGIGEHPDVAENKRLIEDGTRIIEDYADAELACANAINRFVPGRTPFEKTPSGDGALDPDVFYHGYEEDLSDLATEWGMGGAAVDESWLVDGWDAVWDFGVGAVEGTGAMLGMHSSEGWFEMSWGDALYEYHESNIQSVASLVGMYDAESDSYGWSGWDTVGSAWKDLAHSVVPWEEWGERPGYVIGTAVLNIGVTALGAALSATGVGAVVGVPLMAWRGMAIVDGMGGRGGDSGSGGATDTDVDLPANVPTFGGSGAPVLRIDTSVFDPDGLSPQQLGELRGSLDRLQRIANDPADGSHADGSPPPRSTPVQGEGDPSQPRRPAAQPVADRETEANERPARPRTETTEVSDEPRKPARTEPEPDRAETDDEQGSLDDGAENDRVSSPAPALADTSDTSHRSSPNESSSQDPTAEQLSESNRLLQQVNGMFTTEDHANFQVNQRAETALYEGDRATVDPGSSPLKDSQVAERYGLDGRVNATFSDMRAVASDYPHVNWEGGPGDGRDVRNGHDGRDEPETDKEFATTAPRPHADTVSAQKPIPHSRVQHVDLGDSSGHRIDASRVGAPDARSGSELRNNRGDRGDEPRAGGLDNTNSQTSHQEPAIVNQDVSASAHDETSANSTQAVTGTQEPTGGSSSNLAEARTAKLSRARFIEDIGGSGPTPNEGAGPVKPERDLASQKIEASNTLAPAFDERFGDRGGLSPNTKYDVFEENGNHRGEYTTNEDGEIRRIEMEATYSDRAHPELANPRPHTAYHIKTNNTTFTFETNSRGRNLISDGHFTQDRAHRIPSEDTAVRKAAERYYEAYNRILKEDFERNPGKYPGSTEAPQYELTRWNGGHVIGVSEYGGIPERLNQVAMMEEVNKHQMNDWSLSASYRNFESYMLSVLNSDFDYPRGKIDKPSWHAEVDYWQSCAENGPNPPKLHVRVSQVYDPDLPRFEVKTKKGKVIEILDPPPSAIFVEYWINGFPQQKITYPNAPDLT
ncbi:hypothetical protein [Nocardiopsis deserti]|uniref:hypothetical protein n=1 Tax=Nocardiopsis deserti TaxID=2605988 RepID=UPI00123AE024|nr:hypothetical protein [Nocardiopsis deserti]